MAPKLSGCSLLIVEPHSLVLMDIQKIFEDAGAKVLIAVDSDQALTLACHPGLSVAIVDYSLAVSNSSAICNRLTQLGVPYIFCSARNQNVVSDRSIIEFIEKPFHPEDLINAVIAALGIGAHA